MANQDTNPSYSSDSRTKKTAKTRIRQYKPKTRTGCKTCKIRRVKCGEERPACARCTSTGRVCDGYELLVIKQDIKSPSLGIRTPPPDSSCLTIYRPSADIPGTDDERHSFHYFRTKTIGEISGLFGSEFWEYDVLQASHFEPTIKNALLALSAMHEAFHHKGQQLSQIPQDGFAMQQYTKAVGLLASEIATKREQSLQVTLMSCMIFVFLELCRDDSGKAMQHLKSGLQILQNWQANKRLDKNANPKQVKCASRDVEASLVILYRRMNISATIHGSQDGGFTSRYSVEEARRATRSPDTFHDIAMASREMDIQLVAIFHNVRTQHEIGPGKYCALNRRVNEHHLLRLEMWYQGFEKLLSTSSKETQTTGALLLQIHYKTIKILLSSIHKQSEMWYDSHDDVFEEILELAETIINQDKRFNGKYANLSTEFGIIAPVFYTGIRCRKLALRRKAEALMKISPLREGLWNARKLLRYVTWKIDKEEALRGDVPESETLPLNARMGQEQFLDVTIDGAELRLFKYEHGPVLPNGERIVMQEFLPMEWADFKGMI